MTKCNIECKWLKIGRIVINPDGQVLPCCFFANSVYVSKAFGYPTTHTKQKSQTLDQELVNYEAYATKAPTVNVLKDYIANADDLNIFNNPLDEILAHPWFEQLYQSWDDSNKVSSVCVKHCTINK
jgi:hypothetical protein